MTGTAPRPSEGDVNLSLRRAEWEAASLDAETRALLREDARYFLHQSLSTPCLNALRGAEGIYLEDLQGRRYMDFHGNSVHQVGFGNRAVIEAIKAQLDVLSFSPRRYTNRPAVELAKRLTALAPGDLNKVLFCPGGTSAIGMALKLARVVTGRHKVVSMWDSFHGASLDAISVGGEELFRRGIGPLLPGVEHVPPPDAYRCVWDCGNRGGCDLKCAGYVEYVLEKEGDIAAVVAETVRSTPFIPPREYWQAVRRACDRHGALLVLDEIPTALGRTGAMFACEHYGITPDMLVLGKGLGGGILPLAALVVRERFDVAGHLALGHYTHEKNPVACAAALATISYIEDHALLAHARELGQHALGRLETMKARHALIGDVRGLGLLLGAELVSDRSTKARAIAEAEDVMYRCLSKGLSFKLTMGNIITLIPPLTITQSEMDRALDILDQCLGEVESRFVSRRPPRAVQTKRPGMIDQPTLKPGETLLYTLRHGLTELNRSKRTGGRLDVPLLDVGRLQAQEARGNFDGVQLDVVIASSLLRAIETAEIVTGWPRDRILIEDLAVERSFGEMEGLTQDEIRERFPFVIYVPIDHVRYSLNPPAGESFEALRARARALLEKILQDHRGRRVLVSSHQNFMQQLHGELRGLDPYASLRYDILNLELNQFHLAADDRLLDHRTYFLCPDASRYPSF